MTEFDKDAVLAGLRHFMPVARQSGDFSEGRLGLVLVDPVVGFTTEGNLSDPESIQPMVTAIDEMCRDLIEQMGDRLAIWVFRDHHGPDQIEPPYPPHCQEGTGEELLDPKLRWLNDEERATVFPKDCINGMIGSMTRAVPYAVTTHSGSSELVTSYQNKFVDWLVANEVDQLAVVGDCTDICVMDFVVSVLSARNHGMFGKKRREMAIQVHEPACATFHMPDPEDNGLPETARHDRDISHHAALYFMQSRGAVILDRYSV